MAKLFYTDGAKAVNLLNSDDPDVWQFYTGRKDAEGTELYGRVPAVFRVINAKSEMVSSVPFALMKGDREVDSSEDWQNTLGFMPNPQDIFRRLSQSISMSNMGYLMMGKNAFGYPKALNYVTVDSITINTDPITGRLRNFERVINGRVEQTFAPDDKNLIRFWWLDDKTELIPTPNSEFRALMNAAGVLFWGDMFTKLYFERGGVKPTLIAMKGLTSREKTEDMQRDWTTFVRRIGQGAKNIAAKIFNADAMTIEPFGEGLGDLKETPVFRQALENIAIASGLSLSSLLSNSANYATATVEERRDYRRVIVPRFDFIARCLNEQLLEPMGYRIVNRAERTDAEQEDEVQRGDAAMKFGQLLTIYPTYDLLVSSLVGVLGYEVTEEWLDAAKEYYASKEQKPAEVTPTEPEPEEPEDETEDETEDDEEMPKAWMPSVEQMEELRIWHETARRYFKRAQRLDYIFHKKEPLPNDVIALIKSRLNKADSLKAISDVFKKENIGIVDADKMQPQPDEGLIELAKALNAAAEALAREEKPITPPSMTFNLTANMPEVGASPVTVTADMTPVSDAIGKLGETIAAKDLTIINQVDVQPAQNAITVQPSPMIIAPPRSAQVVRGRDGKIERLEAE